eukprot:UN02729
MFWVTAYLLQVVGKDQIFLIGSAYLFDGVSAPPLGALVGGYVIDNLGGYKGKEQLKISLRFMTIAGFFSALSCFLAAFSKNFYIFVSGVWLLFFFGGCVVSPGSGLCITLCGEEYKTYT